MVRNSLLAILFFVATSHGVASQTIMGAGMTSCGEWLRLRTFQDREGQHFQELASLYQIEAWVDGLLSGLNSTIDPGEPHSGPDLLASHIGSSALYASLDGYCRAKPLDYVASAAFALARDLRSRAGQ